MVSPRTPNWRVVEDIQVSIGRHEYKTIPAESYVRPIELGYVPQHVIDKWPGFDKANQKFVYCKLGIVPVPINLLREA